MRQGSCLGMDPCVYDIHDQVTTSSSSASKHLILPLNPRPSSLTVLKQ